MDLTTNSSVLWLVLPVGVLAGAVSAIAGFGVGSLLTPLLTPLFGAKLAVAIVSIPHTIATLLRLWRFRSDVSMRWCSPARPAHRRTRALLPTRRDAADPEQTGELGDVPDRHSRCDRQGQGEQARPVQPTRACCGHPQAALSAWAGRLRLRDRPGRLPGEHPDRVGDAQVTGP